MQTYRTEQQVLVKNWISKYTPNDSILLYWKVGSGKTCGAISIAEGFKNIFSIKVLVKNKNIEDNFKQELLTNCTFKDYLSDEERKTLSKGSSEERSDVNKLVKKRISEHYSFMTYGTFTNKNKSSAKDSFDNSVIIVDEVHNVTTNDTYTALLNVLKVSANTRLILLTATPIFNDIREIVEISNLLNATNTDLQLPIRNDLITEKFITRIDDTSSLGYSYLASDKFKSKLAESLKDKVSFFDENTQDFPEVIDKGIIECQMSSYQYNLYKKAIEADTKTTILPEGKGLYTNSSLASTMVFPDDSFEKESLDKIKPVYKEVFDKKILEKYSCKLKRMMDIIESEEGKVFVYSNYVKNAGTELVKLALMANGYSLFNKNSTHSYKNFIVYTNETSIESRVYFKKIFNSRDNSDGKIIRIIIGSPSVSEGITFKAIRQVHILEPAWNLSRIRQVIGRAVRRNSHKELPVEKRNVKIFKYVSIGPSKETFYIDKEKYILSQKKEESNREIDNLVQNISIETYKDKLFDEVTYNLNLEYFEKEQLINVYKILEKMFSEWWMYSLDEIYSKISIDKHIVLFALQDMINKKKDIKDMYNRSCFLIQAQDYIVLNPVGKNIQDTFYTKYLDFAKSKEFAEEDTNIKTEKVVSEVSASYNIDNLKQTVYGTYKNRKGEVDQKFRIIDLRNKTKEEFEDKRKTITGTVATSLEKSILKKIIQDLNMTSQNLSKVSTKELIKIIETHVTDNNLIL
jgi:superfamily II DNA or RNA helicase